MPISPPRARRAVAGAALAGLAVSVLVAQSATAVGAPVTATPSLTSLSTWHEWVPSTYDYELTTKGGAPALRFSNAKGPYGNITQLSAPAVAEVGEPSTGASYRVFTADFTIDAFTYSAQPGLAVEVSADESGNRSGGSVVFRQDADDTLTLSTYWADYGSAGDMEDWNNDTAEIPFTGPVKIRYVAEYNAGAPDSVKVYANNVLVLEGQGFEAYHDADSGVKQQIDSLLFRTNTRVPVPGEAWATAEPTEDQQAALLGHGFYFSKIEYGASNVAIAPSAAIAVQASITGTTVVGAPLTAVAETNVVAPTLGYQWQREGLSIAGATGATYTLTANDVSKRISVKITASKPGYTTGSATSAKTAAVSVAALSFSTPASIAGTPKLGQTLTASAATTPAASYAYQWYRDGAAIKGATAATYKATASDVGTQLTVKVTASKAGYATLSDTSDPTAEVAPGTQAVGTVKLTGKFKVGWFVTAAATGFSKGASLKYAFYADGELVQYSASPTYKLTWEEQGTSISVIATAALKGYTKVESAETAPQGPVRA